MKQFPAVCIMLSLLFLSCSAGQNPEIFGAAENTGLYRETALFRMAETAPRDHPSAMASAYFATLVSLKTSDKIKIQIYYDGTLGSPEEVLDQLQFGGIAIGRVNMLDLAEKVPSLKYDIRREIRESPEDCMQWIDRNREKLLYDCQTEKLIPAASFFPDLRCFYSDSATFRLKKTADFQGLKTGIQSSSILREVIGSLGAIPLDIVSADTYKSLNTGYMHVRESALADFVLSNDYRFITCITISTYIASPDVIVMSKEALNDISPQHRELLTSCAQAAAEYQKIEMERFYSFWIPEMQRTKDVIRGIR